MNALLIAVLAGLAAESRAAAPAPPKPGVQASSGAATGVESALASSPALALGVSTYTVTTLYTGDRVRDPFLPPAVGGTRRPREGSSPEAIDIHTLQLHGIMRDTATDYAIFTSDFGTTLILRKGRLYDERNRVVFGITGRIRIKQKRVELVTADRDVQVFRLGEAQQALEASKAKPL